MPLIFAMNPRAIAGITWHLWPGQRLIFEEFDDAIVMFDAVVGSTHVLNVTTAETLAIVQESTGLVTSSLYARLLQRLGVGEHALPKPAMDELLCRLEDLQLICARVE
jgi:PqqD family protein of HPr-rel-A system